MGRKKKERRRLRQEVPLTTRPARPWRVRVFLSRYKKWSLPEKCSFWGLVLGVVVFAWPVASWVIAVPENTTLAFNHGTSEMTIYGGAGESRDTAVIIRGANSDWAGVAAEYYWIRRRYPGYRPVRQAVITGGRSYDLIVIRSWYGRRRFIYFDIAPFLGKEEKPSATPGDPGGPKGK